MMYILENFLSSPTEPPVRPGFQEQAWEKVLVSYQASAQRKNFFYTLRWLLPVPLIVAFSVMVFTQVSGEITNRQEIKQLDQQTQQMETQITQDPAITEVLNLSQ